MFRRSMFRRSMFCRAPARFAIDMNGRRLVGLLGFNTCDGQYLYFLHPGFKENPLRRWDLRVLRVAIASRLIFIVC